MWGAVLRNSGVEGCLACASRQGSSYGAVDGDGVWAESMHDDSCYSVKLQQERSFSSPGLAFKRTRHVPHVRVCCDTVCAWGACEGV